MARRTKQDALATRDSILDAAELLFEKQGVSRTTLQHIAAAAGVTRGAIYWHFQDKSALFNAMMERATMPLEAVLRDADDDDASDPAGEVRNWLLTLFRLTVCDPKARRVFDIATHKIEYVDELTGVRDRHLASYNLWLTRAEERLADAVARGQVKPDVLPSVTALGLWALADGLIRRWLLDPQAFDLMSVGCQVVDSYIGALRVVTK